MLADYDLIIGNPVINGSAKSLLFVDDNGNFQQSSGLVWDDVNKSLGVGMAAEPLASQAWTKTVGPLATSSTPVASNAGAYGSNFNAADSASYFVLGYFTVNGTLYYKTPSGTTGLSIANTGDAVQIDWDADPATEGYIVVRDFNGDGFGSYFDVGNVTSMLDDNGNSFAWIVAPYPTTPNTLTFPMYANVFDTSVFPFVYASIIGDDGYFRTAAATFTGNVGIGVSLPTHPLHVDNAITENNTATAVIIKNNSGLGTGNNIEFGRCALVIHNPNGSSQTMMAFTTGDISSPTMLGGLRVDHNGSYSWEALSTAGHYFFVGGIGTQHAAGFFSVNGNSSAYGLTIGSTTAPTGDNVLDVYGAANFRGDITLSAKNIVTDTSTGLKLGTSTSQKIGFFNKTPVAQQADGAALTNSVTSGGTTNTIANYTDLSVYANDAAAIRNNIYQLARKMKIVDDALRLYGLLS